MQSCAKMLVTLSFLMIALAGFGQEAAKTDKPDVLARLSYKSSAVVQRDGLQRMCMAISRDREYHMIRLTENGETLRVQGTLSKEQFEAVTQLLESPKFRKLSGNGLGLIRQDAETFAAEIPLGDKKRADGTRIWIEPEARRVRWLNPDGESPFPDSVEKIVSWMEHFQPKNEKEFEYAEFPDVCPSGTLQFVQPTVAENQKP